MQFVDTNTPDSAGRYIDVVTGYPQDGTERTRQLSSDWATMYYQNAYNTAVMNYQNQYNSPLQQMLRYQEAGINPFLAAQDAGQMSSPAPGGAPKGSYRPATQAEQQQAAAQTVNSLNRTIQTAQELYDYIQYQRPMRSLQLETAGVNLELARNNEAYAASRAQQAQYESEWSRYWNLGPEGFSEGSPRAQYMENSTQRLAAQIDQLDALVNVIYPTQAAANAARAALDVYKKSVMFGETGAILNIDTGNTTADAILKSVVLNLVKNTKFGLFL